MLNTHYKSLLKTGIVETAVLTLGLLVYGHCIGVIHAHPNRTPIDAIKQGDYAGLKNMLTNGANPNSKDAFGTPLLMQAVLYADVETVRLLLSHGADPNATNEAGATALIWAAGDPDKAAVLMNYGANPNARSALGRTPLLVAAATDGAGPVVKALIKKGANTAAKDELKGNPRLMTGGGSAPAIVEAAKARDGVALRLLLADPKVDVNAADGNGGTALTEAVINGNYDNVRLLLAAGASLDVTVSASGYPPLVLAALRGDDRMVAMLLEAGADPNSADAAGSTALMWAAYSSDKGPSASVDMLLRAGADPLAKNLRGDDALTWARWHGKTQTVMQLTRSALAASR